MLAACHLRRFLLDAWPWQSQTFSRSGTKHIHWDNWTQKLSRAAHCRSDRPLEFVNCHARPIATFAAFGLTGFSPRPAPTFAPDAEVADQKPHTHKFWVQVWNTSESFHWSLLINLERSVEVEASLLIDEKIIAGRYMCDAYPKGNMENIQMFWESEGRSPEYFGTRRPF